jgi:hypothetical protein
MVLTGATTNHKVPQDSKPLPKTNSQILILGGSHTTSDQEHDYYNNFTLYKCCTMYPRIVISSLIKWLENLLTTIFYTAYGVSKDHYMSLQRIFLGCMSCHAKVSSYRGPLSPCGSKVTTLPVPT